jgi:hypothetical protein
MHAIQLYLQLSLLRDSQQNAALLFVNYGLQFWARAKLIDKLQECREPEVRTEPASSRNHHLIHEIRDDYSRIGCMLQDQESFLRPL